MSKYLLAIDQGTSSSRAIIFNELAEPVAIAQQEYNQLFPAPSHVEQDPEDIWQTSFTSCQKVLKKLSLQASDIAAIGITNQRETTLIWDKATGKPIHHAIGWQDSRTADFCQQFIQAGHEDDVRAKTGLIINPYFSASKIKWLLDNVAGAREKAEEGKLLFGTVDSFLLWRLTGGKSHKTDATNASRTLLFNIHTQQWDDELLTLFAVPKAILPEVLDSSADFGTTQKELFGGEINVAGIAGDQQAALFGQTCFEPGMVKSTYGTGAFILCNTGQQAVLSEHRLLTTIAYRLHGKATYGLEGSIFVAGAGIKWLRDQLQLIQSAEQTELLAETANPKSELVFVPSFTGLGAPYWDPNARAAITGLSLDTGVAEIVRAYLEGCCFATKDVIDAMIADEKFALKELHVDGGMAASDWMLQFLADMLAIDVKRPKVLQTTALGAAFLAGLQVGVFQSLEHISQLWQCEKSFESVMSDEVRNKRYNNWHKAIQKVLTT